MNLKTSLALILTVGISTAAFAEGDAGKLPPASDKKGVTFAKDIQPIFEKSCVKCHSGEKPKGKLRLDTLENVLKGGADGKVITAGDSTKSMLVKSIAYLGDEDEFMPPPKNKANISRLGNDQVGLVRAWIDQGAK
jgi:hypothetical protein